MFEECVCMTSVSSATADLAYHPINCKIRSLPIPQSRYSKGSEHGYQSSGRAARFCLNNILPKHCLNSVSNALTWNITCENNTEIEAEFISKTQYFCNIFSLSTHHIGTVGVSSKISSPSARTCTGIPSSASWSWPASCGWPSSSTTRRLKSWTSCITSVTQYTYSDSPTVCSWGWRQTSSRFINRVSMITAILLTLSLTHDRMSLLIITCIYSNLVTAT